MFVQRILGARPVTPVVIRMGLAELPSDLVRRERLSS